MSPPLYPLFLSLRGRTCVVVGGNEIAEAKVRDLLAAETKIRLIAPVVTAQIGRWSQAGLLQWEARIFQSGDLRGAFLVVSVAGTETNAKVFEEAEAQQTLCNAVDDIEHCNCYASAVVRRGPLQIAISTSGNSPALAQRLRRQLEEQFGQEYGPWVRRLGELRRRLLHNKEIDAQTRRRILQQQASPSALEISRNSQTRERSTLIQGS
ncbi:MAG TPA: bifunctional precorrin-2 dehydrogenase/sirohydrochlorin ferrochelatase [Terriglobales bacterium]|nr:bifunctional precorrin-2 dehydrogenase/sirohydrochlorin ferrochelatase [Terriglobales bacterium]